MYTPSKTYRNDSDEGIDPALKKMIDASFLDSLVNIGHSNPKVIVVFSGGNALGKSAISSRIESELNGLVLENDRMKEIIKGLNPAAERDWLNVQTWKYSMDLYRRIDMLTTNGLIVRDGVIDWYYDRILPIFEQKDYRVFTIAFDVSKEKRIQLIQQRGDKYTVTMKRLIDQIDEHTIHMKRFRSAYKTDVVLNENNLFDHDLVISKLRQFMTGK